MSIDWSDLYRTTFPDLVRFLHRKVWDPERARDLAQEAFVRALQHQPRKPRAWLFQVASNLAPGFPVDGWHAGCPGLRRSGVTALTGQMDPGKGADGV